MPCPECGKRTAVYDSRLNTRLLIRRRRACLECGFRFATIEIMNEYQPLGKKEKLDAPIPTAPKTERIKPEAKPVKVRGVKRPVARVQKPPGLDEDVVPWTEDREDYSMYVDLPKEYGYE